MQCKFQNNIFILHCLSLKHCRYFLQLLPRAGSSFCHHFSLDHYRPINALLAITWRRGKKKKEEQILAENNSPSTYSPNADLLLTNFPSFSSVGHIIFHYTSASVLCAAFFIKKKMINDLNARLSTVFSLCYGSASFACEIIFWIAKSGDFSLFHLECGKITLKDENMWMTY